MTSRNILSLTKELDDILYQVIDGVALESIKSRYADLASAFRKLPVHGPDQESRQLRQIVVWLDELEDKMPLCQTRIFTIRHNDHHFLTEEGVAVINALRKLTRTIRFMESALAHEIKQAEHQITAYRVGGLLDKTKDSRIYAIDGHHNLVLVTREDAGLGKEFVQAQRLAALHQSVPKHVQFERIYQVGLFGKSLAMVKHKVSGKTVHEHDVSVFEVWLHGLRIVAAIPQRHFNKLVRDMYALEGCGLMSDLSRQDCVLYDSGAGFTFVDVFSGNKSGSVAGPLIHTHNLFTRFGDRVLPDDAKQNVQTILKKLERADDPMLYRQRKEILQRIL